MKSMVVTPLRALLIALGSVLLAYWFFSGGVLIVLAVAVALVLVGAGFVLERLGRRRLTSSNPDPETGVRLMEWWVLVPSGLAAVASAIVIIVAVLLAAPDDASNASKELLSSLAAGITAFLTTMWIDPSKDIDSTIGERIQSACFDAFSARVGTPNTRLAQVLNDVVFPDPATTESGKNVGTVDDWSHEGRILRAKVIAQELTSPVPVDPNAADPMNTKP